jgi:CheY-like chemotaxis protein
LLPLFAEGKLKPGPARRNGNLPGSARRKSLARGIVGVIAKSLASGGVSVLIKAQHSRMSQPQTSPSTETKPLVFAVDDEPMLLELVTMVLEPLGYHVRSFRDPGTALRAFSLSNPRPALIITDFAMHSMNGLDLIRECRRMNPAQKILLVSGTVDETIYRDSPDKPDCFLAKPYPARQLAEMVKSVLRK